MFNVCKQNGFQKVFFINWLPNEDLFRLVRLVFVCGFINKIPYLLRYCLCRLISQGFEVSILLNYQYLL